MRRKREDITECLYADGNDGGANMMNSTDTGAGLTAGATCLSRRRGNDIKGKDVGDGPRNKGDSSFAQERRQSTCISQGLVSGNRSHYSSSQQKWFSMET